MILKDLAPHPSLTDLVQCYRIVHFHFAHTCEPVLKVYAPRPEICLHFFLRQTELIQIGESEIKEHNFPVALAGQQTGIMNRYLKGKDFISFNIVFQPTALFRLTGIPAFELTNLYLDAETIFSTRIRSILDQLQHANSYNEMTAIADQFILSLAAKMQTEPHAIDRVSRLMIHPGGNASLDFLARESYLSVKQFTRKFYERTGINPKTYQRIVRFTRAINLKNAHPGLDWLRIAVECDYFDYQHLVRDYKQFTKNTPNGFHVIESNSPERRLGIATDVYKSRASTPVLHHG